MASNDSFVAWVKRFFEEEEIEYDPEKFAKKVKSHKRMRRLSSKELIREIFPDMEALDIPAIIKRINGLPSPPPSPSRLSSTTSEPSHSTKVNENVCPGDRGDRRNAEHFMKTIGKPEWNRNDEKWLKDKKGFRVKSPPKVVIVGAGPVGMIFTMLLLKKHPDAKVALIGNREYTRQQILALEPSTLRYLPRRVRLDLFDVPKAVKGGPSA